MARRKAAKRDQITSAARRLFLSQGFNGTSMDAVTAEAGVSKQTLYAYFPTKTDLLADVLYVGMDELVLAPPTASEINSLDDLREHLIEYASRLTESLLQPETIALMRLVLGEVFHVECGQGGYHHPGYWWRSDKAISGGAMYDWGAHFLDWILNLVPGKVTQVMGDFQKRVWHDVTNEDHGQAYIRFDSGVTADYWVSTIAAINRPKWLILGTKGAIQSNWSDELTVVSHASGVRLESKVKVTLPGYGSTQYYRNIADHLLLGEPLLVTPESARRVIGVIDAAQRSSALGQSVAPAPGCE